MKIDNIHCPSCREYFTVEWKKNEKYTDDKYEYFEGKIISKNGEIKGKNLYARTNKYENTM